MQGERFFELIHLYLSKKISVKEQVELDSAITNDEKLSVLFKELTKPKNMIVGPLELEEKFGKTMNATRGRDEVNRTVLKISRNAFLKYAAAILIGIFTCSVLYYGISNSYNVDNFSQKIETKNGERKNVTLPDGTHVWLNSASTIAFKKSFGKENRDISLTGEAYFEVSKNQNLPMYINAKELTVKVVGTSFNVRSYPDENRAEASLVEGKIELFINKDQKDSKFLQVIPGEKISVNYDKKLNNQPKNSETSKIPTKDMIIQKSIFLKNNSSDVPAEIAWKENKLVFDKEPFDNIISKLEKWYDVQIEIKNDSLKQHNLSGNMESDHIEDVLELLKSTGIEFKFKKENNLITIY
ncbi:MULTISPECIES: FecR family protein [Sphingobacterium]|uniref:FecR family protein n=1 Tax=Sphingobacterium tenebrionis TaxID=3111775 RepID=A0ABU8I1Q3_9SPHI|nr:FecR family protein [Sphingobacterium sp. CZ-2]QBR11024.1 FecR family protein [Sphingobacterium sp. CZ-2]